MNKHLVRGLIVGGAFALAITWVAIADALAEGGLALSLAEFSGLPPDYASAA